MSSNLLDEAIADAKQIRELAEENAKKAVLEAVTPKIKAILFFILKSFYLIFLHKYTQNFF